jgi:PDZ domain-containing secreted protein
MKPDNLFRKAFKKDTRKPHGYKTVSMKPVFILAVLTLVLSSCMSLKPQEVKTPSSEWQEEFNLTDRKLSNSGEAQYFILEPGFEIVLASKNAELVITVLDETKSINGISTRVVEERETFNGELYEISRNFYAIDQESGDAFYFGEEVDFYTNGVITGHSGEWLAYENENRPGLIMPAKPVVGMKYYQEIAPGVAMDRAKVVSVSETFTTPAGEFENCLLTQESSQVEPTAIEYKTYCPGTGLVQDQSMTLIRYGYKD